MNNKKFKDLYIEFENAITKTYPKETGTSANKIKNLRSKKINPFYNKYDFIDFCRDCRNITTHDIYGNEYLNFPEEMIENFQAIVEEVKHPFTIYNKATINVFTANLNDNVKKIMREMINKSYTHVPIYHNNKLVGIFSENTLFNYLYENEIVEISDETLFCDIKDYIDINNYKEIIKFVARDELYDKVVNSFIEEFKNKNKLSCVLVTNSGKPTEKILGILTAWDIVGR